MTSRRSRPSDLHLRRGLTWPAVSQNIYDDGGFFDGYSRLPRSQFGLDGAPEWPVIRELLPEVAGLDIVDLGCGFGWFARWARAHGASSVIGIDLSEKMLERARRDTNDPGISYQRQDLEHLVLPNASFDLAYSSLTLHYIVDLDGMLATVHRCLRPGGKFVATVEHPILLSPSHPDFIDAPHGGKVWPLDRYLIEGERLVDWLADGVRKQHRTIEGYLAALRQAGFQLADLREWGPSPEQVAEHPEWADELHRPYFLLLSVQKGTVPLCT